ncbi:MAG: oligopeptide/dipeptide ABC transporter ATP-binding protein [Alsobacter sp.]
MSAPAAPLVRVVDLRRDFDVSRGMVDRLLSGEGRQVLRAVDGVSFSVAPGETFAIVGESGSGKSTVARMVAGLLRPTAGRVEVAGEPVEAAGRAARKRLRRRLQMIFQDPYASLDPRWSVRDIVAEPIRAFGLARGRAAVEARVAELLGLVGLDAADAGRHPHAFSGGQRQRIAIARALAAESEVIVCDEPTSALDVSVQAQILNLMRDLQDRLALTYLFISHNLAVVRHMATTIGVMYAGRLVEVGPARALFAAPRHPYTRMLLEAVPDLARAGAPPGERLRPPPAGEPPNPIRPPPGCAFHPRCPLAVDRCRREVPALAGGVACHVANA